MKKLTTIIMSLALTLGLTACSGNTSSNGTSATSGTTSGTSSVTAPTDAPETAETPTESTAALTADKADDTDSQTGKTLVVYYSGSGHTEQVAQYIAQAADADLFEITPAEPYTSEDLNYNAPRQLRKPRA